MTMTFPLDSSSRVLHSKSILEFLPFLLLCSVRKLATFLGHPMGFLGLPSSFQRFWQHRPSKLCNFDLQFEVRVEAVRDIVREL